MFFFDINLRELDNLIYTALRLLFLQKLKVLTNITGISS